MRKPSFLELVLLLTAAAIFVAGSTFDANAVKKCITIGQRRSASTTAKATRTMTAVMPDKTAMAAKIRAVSAAAQIKAVAAAQSRRWWRRRRSGRWWRRRRSGRWRRRRRSGRRRRPRQQQYGQTLRLFEGAMRRWRNQLPSQTSTAPAANLRAGCARPTGRTARRQTAVRKAPPSAKDSAVPRPVGPAP